MRQGAEIIDNARLLRGKGIDEDELSINWADLMKHKHGFTDPISRKMTDGLTANGVATLHGQARFGPVTASTSTAQRMKPATSRSPPAHAPAISTSGHEYLIDNADFHDLHLLPPRILFVGGGFISFEFAHMGSSRQLPRHHRSRGRGP